MTNCRKCGEELLIFENPEAMDDKDFYCEDCKRLYKKTKGGLNE